TALEFTKELQKLASKNVDYIILDLSKVELMNSSGLGMLVSGLSSMKKNDIRLVLADVPEKVNNLLNMTHLDKVFEIYENVADAESKLA
ncbi:MAG: STAS domain-containing protein, partial [Candidatus Kapaibacterium sp.]